MKAQPRSRLYQQSSVLLVVGLLIFVCVFSLLLIPRPASGAFQAGRLPAVAATGAANYQAETRPAPLQPLNHGILISILSDQALPGEDVNARLVALENSLLTPIPTAMRAGNPMIVPTAAPGVVETATAVAPSPTLTPPETGTVTPAPGASPTFGAIFTATGLPTATAAFTGTPAPTLRPSGTVTLTASPAATATQTLTAPFTPSATFTFTPTYAFTPTLAATWTATNTPSALPTPTRTPTAAPIPPTATFTPRPALHVGNMTGSAADAGDSFWVASVDVQVHNQAEQPMANVRVTGQWSDSGIGDGDLTENCTTNAAGWCRLVTNRIQKHNLTTTYSISGLALAGYTYNAGFNHDPGGCETAGCNSITVHK